MDEAPSREQLKDLVNSLRELQGRILAQIGPPTHFLQSLAANVEPLKTPIYVLWQLLGYGDFPQNKVQRQWLASFKTSPPDFLSECITQTRTVTSPSMTSRCAANSSTSIQNSKNNFKIKQS